jgi:cbb3-type cytochrome oxidase maturation protein
MDVLILLIFISLALVGSAVAFFAWTLRKRTYEHSDRLSLLPLEEGASREASTQRKN